VRLSVSFLICFVGLLHLWFFVLESFLWTTPLGRKIFQTSQDTAEATKILAKNQGVYNAFLASGLFWSVSKDDLGLKSFFLICVIIAGLVGGFTVNRKILIVQALPALVALMSVWGLEVFTW
jgi:putative membrane protein